MLYFLVFLSLLLGLNAYAKAQEAKSEIRKLRQQLEQEKEKQSL